MSQKGNYTPDLALTDRDLMPNGQYKGELMQNVPASHLLWIYENNLCRPDVQGYIKNNLETIKKQASKKR